MHFLAKRKSFAVQAKPVDRRDAEHRGHSALFEEKRLACWVRPKDVGAQRRPSGGRAQRGLTCS